MGYGKVLVAYDGSQASHQALVDAFDLVDHGLAERVVVLSVIDTLKDGDPAFNAAARSAGVLYSTIGDEEADLSDLQSKVGDVTRGREDMTNYRIVYGKPAESIVSVAEAEECGLIVMGRRGVGAVRGLLGSVSSAVLRASKLPVLVTK